MADMPSAPPRLLVVAYCLPPHAAIGTHRPLRLIGQASADGWSIDILTVKPETYIPGTPVDRQLLQKVPQTVRVARAGAIRPISFFWRGISPLVAKLRSGRQPRLPLSQPPEVGSPALPAKGAFAGRLKRTIEELVAMPDKDVGWVLPAILVGLRRFTAARPDVLYSTAPPWSGHLIALALSKLWRRPWVADFRDPWVRSPWGRYSTSVGRRLGAWLERVVVTRASAVLFTTEAALSEFSVHYGPEVALKFHAVYNGCDVTEFELGPPVGGGPFVVLHAGSIYGGRSPMPVLRAVALLKAGDPSLDGRLLVRFLGATTIAGSDPTPLCEGLGIGGMVEFCERVSRRESLRQMQSAGALLILQAGLNLAIPGKLYEYFAAGRPVLALCEEGEMADLIRANGAGEVVSTSDEQAIASAIERLMQSGRDWTPVPPAAFDGRLRAVETMGILARVRQGSIVGVPAGRSART